MGTHLSARMMPTLKLVLPTPLLVPASTKTGGPERPLEAGAGPMASRAALPKIDCSPMLRAGRPRGP